MPIRPVIVQRFLRRQPALWLWLWLGLVTAAPLALAQTVPPDSMAARVAPCVACHGKDGIGAEFNPRIAGKPAGYLYNQLRNFRDGRRRYPQMIYMVDHLSDAYLLQMATYFSALHPPYPAPLASGSSDAMTERGRTLAQSGDATHEVPACTACHGAALTGVLPATPGLLGLPRDYLSAQFGAWKDGARKAAAPDCMATIASRLSTSDISAVTGWLAAQPLPEPNTAVPPGPTTPPMTCGTVPKP